MNHARTLLGLFTLIGSFATLGCGDDEPKRLFDEDGTWSMIEYSLDGGALKDVDPLQRKDAFMLQFDRDNRVVTAAACIDVDNGAISPADAPCATAPSETNWVCTCYGYAFEEDQMRWVEFPAGSPPPKVSLDGAVDNTPPPAGDEAGATGTGDGGEAGGEPAGDATITVGLDPDRGSTVVFSRMPVGLFGASMMSRFVFQKKVNSLFDRAFNDTERGTCEPCIP